MRVIIFLSIYFISFKSSGVNLVQAVNEKKINATFQSTGNHSGACVEAQIKNLTSQWIQIEVEPGTYLTNEDEAAQDHLITEDATIALAPHSTVNRKMYAMCCQQNDRCPKKNSVFTASGYRNETHKGLCQLIYKLKMQNYGGQEAIWALIGKGSPNTISGEDSARVMQLRKFVGKANNIPVKPYRMHDYIQPAMITRERNLSIKTQGNHYVYNVSEGDEVISALYTEEDSMITVPKKEWIPEIGEDNFRKKYNVVWNFEAEQLNPDKKYFLRIKVNGVTRKEWIYKWGGI